MEVLSKHLLLNEDNGANKYKIPTCVAPKLNTGKQGFPGAVTVTLLLLPARFMHHAFKVAEGSRVLSSQRAAASQCHQTFLPRLCRRLVSPCSVW